MKHRCTGRNRQGQQCARWAIPGGTVCKLHGGGAPQVRALAEVRSEVLNWKLGDATVDPGETLLRLLSQSRWRAERYAARLAEIVEEHGLEEALVGESWVMSDNGTLQKVGEYVKGLATLEAQERDRCARFATQAIAAGLAERTVRLAERQTEIAEKALLAALEDLGLDDGQRRHAVTRLAHHLQLVG